jgi:hypothetical protein
VVRAGSYRVPPYDGYKLQQNLNGKPSSSPSFTTTNDYLCPCIINGDGRCTNQYGAGEITEYKYKGIYSGHGGKVSVSYAFKVKGFVGVQGSGLVRVTSTISLYDSSGNLVDSRRIFRYTLTSGSHTFNEDTFTGIIYFSVSGYTTYTILWTVDLYSQSAGNADFYNPNWFTNDMTINTPAGGSII